MKTQSVFTQEIIMRKYRFIEGITEADYAFEAFGKDLNELFVNSAIALMSCQADLKSVEKKVKKDIVLENESIETLLFDFLQQIVYLKDAESLIFNNAKVDIKKNKVYKLKATFFGDIIQPEKQKLGVDIKAVTYHKFGIEKIKDGIKAVVVLDA